MGIFESAGFGVKGRMQIYKQEGSKRGGDNFPR